MDVEANSYVADNGYGDERRLEGSSEDMGRCLLEEGSRLRQFVQRIVTACNHLSAGGESAAMPTFSSVLVRPKHHTIDLLGSMRKQV